VLLQWKCCSVLFCEGVQLRSARNSRRIMTSEKRDDEDWTLDFWYKCFWNSSYARKRMYGPILYLCNIFKFSRLVLRIYSVRVLAVTPAVLAIPLANGGLMQMLGQYRFPSNWSFISLLTIRSCIVQVLTATFHALACSCIQRNTQSSKTAFLNWWNAPHWWDLTIGWVGRGLH
jgi:hypothetical protein